MWRCACGHSQDSASLLCLAFRFERAVHAAITRRPRPSGHPAHTARTSRFHRGQGLLSHDEDEIRIRASYAGHRRQFRKYSPLAGTLSTIEATAFALARTRAIARIWEDPHAPIDAIIPRLRSSELVRRTAPPTGPPTYTPAEHTA